MIPNGYTYCSNSCVLLAAQAQKKEVIPNNELSLLRNIFVEKCFISKEFNNNKKVKCSFMGILEVLYYNHQHFDFVPNVSLFY